MTGTEGSWTNTALADRAVDVTDPSLYKVGSDGYRPYSIDLNLTCAGEASNAPRCVVNVFETMTWTDMWTPVATLLTTWYVAMISLLAK